MNRRRTESHTTLVSTLAVIVAACIVAAGGVLYAYYKNRQVQVSRQIDETRKNIGACRADIRTLGMRMDQQLNLFAIRERLQQQDTGLRPITRADIEEIVVPPATDDRKVARNSH